MEFEKSPYHEIYVRAAGAVAYVAVLKPEGDEGVGSCFHIGEGIFVTARHVVEGMTIREIATTKSARLTDEAGGAVVAPRRLQIVDGPHFGPDNLDVAVFRVDLGGQPLPKIAVSAHTEYDIEEHDFILADVVILGYPPIPFTTIPVQVATLGQINAVVRVWHSPESHFVASTMARGGFSGGVALDRSGTALALVTESLGTERSLVETGYTSLLSIASAVDLAAEKFGFSVHGEHPGRYTETLIAIRLSKRATTSLSSYVYDAHLFVYDDNRDVFLELTCDDDTVLGSALDAFGAIVPLTLHQREPGRAFLTPVDNPTPQELVDAAEAARNVLVAADYVEIAAERSRWQLEAWGGSYTTGKG